MEVGILSHGGQASKEVAAVSRYVSWYYESSANITESSVREEELEAEGLSRGMKVGDSWLKSEDC